MTTPAALPRTVRVPDELWVPFQDLVKTVEHATTSVPLRRFIRSYLDDYKVFWAPEHPDLDPSEAPIPWYECVECDDVHRLSGVGAPWGCSVTKSRDDRLKASAA